MHDNLPSTSHFPLSTIGLGGGALSGEGGGYGFGPISHTEAVDLLLKSYDLGCNVVDSAPVYGYGLAEQRIGESLRGRREEVYLISKGGITWDLNKRIDIDNSPKVIQSMLHQSLRDLKTDYIDTYMIHWPDPRTDIRKPMEVLSKAKEKGLIKSIGLSNPKYDDVNLAREIDSIDSLQGERNLFHNPLEKILPLWEADSPVPNIFTWGTFDKGILTGRVTNGPRTFHPLDARSYAPWWKKDRSKREKKIAAVGKIQELLQNTPFDLLQVAINFSQSWKYTSTSLCGFRNPQQITDGVRVSNDSIPPDLMLKIQAICDSTKQTSPQRKI